MDVININDKLEIKKQDNEQRRAMLEVLDEMRKQIESGEIKEFVAASICKDGSPQIHIACWDLASGVGLFEIGKHMFIISDVNTDEAT
jgi:hypothetical protein